MLDILIKNGTIIDGTGKPGFVADLAVKGGVIEEIGSLGNVKAKTTIEAAGHYVAPGFIDVTNHSDVTSSLFQAPSLESMALQGVTTIIGGNCGVSLAPLTDPDIVHSLRRWSGAVLNVNWLSMNEYLAEVEKKRPALNYGTLVGHGTLRRGVTGEAARLLTLEELAKLKFMLAEALNAGALGLSANLAAAHEHHATADEMIEISKVLAVHGGVFKIHLRDEGRELIAAVNEALRIGNGAGVPVAIAHLKAIGRASWGLMRRAVAMIESTASHGEPVVYDITPYARTGSHLHMLLPLWVREGGFRAMLQRLRDPSIRVNIARELRFLTLHFDKLSVAEAEDGVSPGKTLAELADNMGIDPHEAVLSLLLANRGRVVIIGTTLQKQNIELGVMSSRAIVASNGSAHHTGSIDTASHSHPRSFGAFPHFLHTFVRDRKKLSWEEGIRKITSLPARFLGLKKRGEIIKSNIADLVIFHPNGIKDRATYKNPFLPPQGILNVIVSGVLVVSEGKMTGERPGRVIRKT